MITRAAFIAEMQQQHKVRLKSNQGKLNKSKK